MSSQSSGEMPREPQGTLQRRRFVRNAIGCAVLGFVSPAPRWLAPSGMGAGFANPITPDEALAELRAGNERYVSNRMTSIHQDLAALRQQTVSEQHPFAAVLGCADSRVAVELLFDQSIGRLFVVRVAGNVAAPEVIASLEYAVADLGVGAVVVLGHANCGAVKAALKSEQVPGQISSLYPYLRPAVERGAGDLQQAVEANAQHQAELLRTSSIVIRDALGKRTIAVTAAVYDLSSGRVALA
ncbi:MAG TPA: carbonic anhydrase [Gemmatimonadaceae bacterium]|nr:carbonic anhydrase [Gemmatimonadaceae bacterium]